MTTGTSLKVKKGAKDFDDDGDAANAYAIGLALTQGAVGRLSAAVSKALSSSTDVNKAMTEALSVQSLEEMLGGPLAAYRKAFADFERTAKERVRIAREYGFDVLAIEKRNGEDPHPDPQQRQRERQQLAFLFVDPLAPDRSRPQ